MGDYKPEPMFNDSPTQTPWKKELKIAAIAFSSVMALVVFLELIALLK